MLDCGAISMQADKPYPFVSLPPFPAIALQVLKLIDRDRVGMNELTELIRADPAFSSELLVMANSPLFAIRAEVKSVRHAAVVLGLQRVKALALTVGLKAYLVDAVNIPVLRGFWRHSVACALLAEEFARLSLMETEFPYVAGLLHDIGRLALAIIHPQQYSDLVRSADENPFDVQKRERELFGIDHCQAGEWLVKSWKLPKDFEDIAAEHHAELEPLGSDIAGLVRWSCLMADTLGFAAIRPPRVHTFEYLVQYLAERERRMLDPAPDQVALRIATKINSLELAEWHGTSAA